MPECGGKLITPQAAETQTSRTCPEITKDQISTHFIVPGETVRNIRIGDSRETVLQSIEACAAVQTTDYPQSVAPYSARIVIGDSGNINPFTTGSGISVFLREDEITQIKVDSYLYSDSLLTRNSLFDEVAEAYPEGVLYKLLGSADADQRNSKDLLYWVVRSKGIAYEFYETKHKTMKVSGIYIYRAGTDFFPFGTGTPSEFTRLVKVSSGG